MKKILLLFFLLLFVSLAFFSWTKRKKIIRLYHHYKNEYLGQSSRRDACSCTNKTLNLNSFDYRTVHIPKLKNNKDLTFIKDNKTKGRLIQKGKLIPIDSKNFKISKLTHSSRHLTPKANIILEELAFRYEQYFTHKGKEKSSIRISSMTRTHEQQKSLSNISKAATKNISAHSFGQAFDIDFVISKDCSFATKTLEMLLNEMQKEGKLLLCPESGCIHVTVL